MPTLIKAFIDGQHLEFDGGALIAGASISYSQEGSDVRRSTPTILRHCAIWRLAMARTRYIETMLRFTSEPQVSSIKQSCAAYQSWP